MANKKITDLTANATLADTDLIWNDTAGSAASQKITGAELKKSILVIPFGIAFGDETTDLETGTAKATFHMPNYATTLLSVAVGVTTAPTGSTAIFDLNEAGTSVLSTKVSIDVGEFHSDNGAIPPVISDSSLASLAKMTVDIDQVGSTVAGTGGKLYITYQRA